uniref:NusG-like N-terminal domain-containing protein n=1 Tax=Rhodopseudomonas palustris (strain DX-1) TaxID=652103 RepID=E6VFL0_RHOPX
MTNPLPRAEAWLCAIIDPLNPLTTVRRLQDELGLAPYLPMEWKSVAAGRGRRREVQVPLLIGYLLLPEAGGLAHGRYGDVLATRGVRGLLHYAGSQAPARLSDATVERLRAEERAADNKRQMRLLAAGRGEWQPGDEVWAEILPGRSLLARISAEKAPRGRIAILLGEEVLGRRAFAVEPKQLQRVAV